MDIATLRKQRNLSQEELASLLGVRSKGYISDIESGTRPASLRLAFLIEAWSGGQIKAEAISPKAEALRSQSKQVARKRRLG